MEYYYISAQNKAEGPVSLEQLQALLSAGQVNAATKVAAVGTQEWIPITNVLPASSFPVGTPSAPPPGFGGQPQVIVAPAITEPLATTSLVLACVSFACGGIFLSIPAVICGHISLSRIKQNPTLQGRGLAVGGLWAGYINIALSLIVLVFYVIMIAAAVAAESHR